ncbi:MAG: GNAT family N-acetyltransferase [Armatimonadota bacterium]|nr:GNAT family N-acetyltransferase [bacterium]
MIDIRLAKSEDASGIVNVVRSLFDQNLLNTFIYGASGITQYIADQISIRDCGSDTVYVVALDDGIVIGMAEMRGVGELMFLNYIGILPEYQAQGIGRQLMKTGVNALGRNGFERIILDVLTSNMSARGWYDRIGFQPQYYMTWWDIALQQTDADGGIIIGYPQARVCYDNFGFAQFRVATPSGDYAVGLMCQEWYRITQVPALIDPVLPSVLRKFDASRRILAILQDDHMPDHAQDQARPIASSVRLAANPDDLIERLS